MNPKNRRIALRLTEQELALLANKAAQASLSMSGFLRAAIHGQKLQAASPKELAQILQGLRRLEAKQEEIIEHCRELPAAGLAEESLQILAGLERRLVKLRSG